MMKPYISHKDSQPGLQLSSTLRMLLASNQLRVSTNLLYMVYCPLQFHYLQKQIPYHFMVKDF
jgi:hypothetical protein